MHRNHIFVFDAMHCFRFSLKAFPSVRRQVVEYLNCDGAIYKKVRGFVDKSEPAGAQGGLQPITSIQATTNQGIVAGCGIGTSFTFNFYGFAL
jgi:hypothetical protein